MNGIRVFILAPLVFLQAACTTMPEVKSPSDTSAPVVVAVESVEAVEAPQNNLSIVKVFFATDRNFLEGANVEKTFGDQRSSVSYGSCDVSIPMNHKEGEVESPSISRFEFRRNPEKHMTLFALNVESKEDFFSQLKERVASSKHKNSFVFVHGFNVTFEEAALRTAQMAYDLGFDGAPIFYSWPSKGKLLSYFYDSDNVKWSEKNLLKFLEEHLENSDSENVYLIAHSMGSRALTGALSSLLRDKVHLQKKLKEVILAAPDIDADVFRRDVIPAITINNQNITMYASSTDKALLASKAFNGNTRAGDSRELLIADGIETVDATSSSTSIFDFGHSYFGQSASILSDISNLIYKNLRAEQRCNLDSADSISGRYWTVIDSKTFTCLTDESGKPLKICCPN